MEDISHEEISKYWEGHWQRHYAERYLSYTQDLLFKCKTERNELKEMLKNEIRKSAWPAKPWGRVCEDCAHEDRRSGKMRRKGGVE